MEREPQQKKTLMYETAAEAEQFQYEVTEKIKQEHQPGVERPREVVADAVAREIAFHGEGASNLSRPWEHTQEEHVEAQALVEMAFSKDLGAALRAARQSEHYPRNLDLFHDVLTNELYDHIVLHKLNRVSASMWLLVVAGVVLLAALGVGLLLLQL